MHLKQLKLAGFKSFVEPTIVPFQSQLVAVVGPNGCGKSNIIDAVRWVMGESSAKNLRGESMIDVIFNGSSHRKPIGQASVELVFDNSLGRLTGPYASYQEIAVKRLVTRDGDSFYYLNGSRCRRRDITDIFLGTGAGARGYSIIGQDTISRLIEARPEELRAYLEEAAGVSKYKERRRETLQRIHHTRENLARVADIRDELEKQLLRLERQAKAAERYTSLKQAARSCKADILALKWHQMATEQAALKCEISAFSLQQERHRTNITGFVKDNADVREKLHLANDHFQEIQVKFYQVNTDIARLEEMIQQALRETQRLGADKAQLLIDEQRALEQFTKDTVALSACEQELGILQANVQALEEELSHHQQLFAEKDVQKIDWDAQWLVVQTAFNEALQKGQIAQLSLQHIEQKFEQTILRLEKIQTDSALMPLEPLQRELTLLKEAHASLITQHNLDAEHHEVLVKKGQGLREQFVVVEQQLHLAHDQVQAITTEHAALLAAQNAALHKVKNKSSVLERWEKTPRLAEVMTVPEQWLSACELVLGESLQAIVLDSMTPLAPSLADLKGHSALFVQEASPSAPARHPRLSEMITGIVPCGVNPLAHVFVAECLEEALLWLPTLNAHESVVTADGYWMGPGWVKVEGLNALDESGLLSRQQAIFTLGERMLVAQDHLKTLKTHRDELHALLADNERENKTTQQALLKDSDIVRVSDAKISSKQQALEHALLRRSTLLDEQDALQGLLEELLTEKMHTAHQVQAALEHGAQQEQQLQALSRTKTAWEVEFKTSRDLVEKTKDARYQAALQQDRAVLKRQQLRDSALREQTQLDIFRERLAVLEARLNALTNPDETSRALFQEKVAVHGQLEAALSKEREQVDALQQRLNGNEHLSQQEAHEADRLQEKIQQAQLQAQGLAVRAEGLVESLTALDADVEKLLAECPAEISLQSREAALVFIDEKIKRLGAINLVAIGEYQTELDRKQQLDEQYQDLMVALTTLDAAIAKMDKETQLRLKETFDQVNESFQALFPRLFEGGHARLELTCDNLLEAGVLVMAQPPGKRNGSIHLLSGGEKAMTAVALVFAIFQQNPSPFCMLDEVDAPLDDMNVKRFCNLVKEMSEFVQFLFITHNKVTMELADHLIGVTMREPGVSRVVAVDVEAAMAAIAE